MSTREHRHDGLAVDDGVDRRGCRQLVRRHREDILAQHRDVGEHTHLQLTFFALRKLRIRRSRGVSGDHLLARQRFRRIVRVRDREHHVEERVQRAVAAEGEWNAGGDDRLERLNAGGPLGAVPRRHDLRDREVRRVLHVDDPKTLRSLEAIAGEELAVLDADPQRLPSRRRRQPLHRREQKIDTAVAGDVEHRLVAGFERASQGTIDVGRLQIQVAGPAGSIGVRRVHRRETLDRRAVEDPFHARHGDPGVRAPRQLPEIRGRLLFVHHNRETDDAEADGRLCLLQHRRQVDGRKCICHGLDCRHAVGDGLYRDAAKRVDRGRVTRQGSQAPMRAEIGILVEAAIDRPILRSPVSAKRWIRIAIADVNRPQASRAEDHAVSRPGGQLHQALRRDIVERETGGVGIGEHLLADRAVNPLIRRRGRGGLAEGREHIGERGIVAFQFQHDARRACAHVSVRVVDSWNDDAATDVDEPGVGARRLADGCRGADRRDPVAADRDRLGPRRRRVGGEDLAVDQEQIESVRLRPESDDGQRQRQSRHEPQLRHGHHPPWTATHKPVPRATPTRSIERRPGVK